MQTTEHRLELLSTAYDALTRADPLNEARAESRLFDAALACGMPFDEPSVSEWVAARLTRWLCAA